MVTLLAIVSAACFVSLWVAILVALKFFRKLKEAEAQLEALCKDYSELMEEFALLRRSTLNGHGKPFRVIEGGSNDS